MKAEKEPDDIMAKALKMGDLVEYQTGSIVSRTLIEKPTGTVTLFAFDEGQGLSEHTAPFDALVCVLEGETEIAISGTPFMLQAGDMIIMPAQLPVIKQQKSMCIIIKSFRRCMSI